VAHAVDTHNANLVGNLVDNAVVADTDPLVVPAVSQFAAARWARVRHESANCSDDAVVNLRCEPHEVPLGGALKQNMKLGHLCPRPAR